jgi:hypothetical protein
MLEVVQCPLRKSFFKFLDDWYYGRLSQSVHFTGEGFLMQSAQWLFADDTFLLRKYQSDSLVTAETLYLCYLSELAIDLTQGGHPVTMLTDVWHRLRRIFGSVDEVWKERYRDLFAQAATSSST